MLVGGQLVRIADAGNKSIGEGTWSAGAFVTIGMWLVMGIIPIALLRVAYGVRFGEFFSIAGKWRWRVALPGFAIMMVCIGLLVVSTYSPGGFSPIPELLSAIILAFITIFAQSAAEELVFRGLLLRVFSAWFSHSGIGFIVSVALSGAAFAVLHKSPSLAHNVMFVAISIGSALLARYSGGLELAIIIHFLTNFLLGTATYLWPAGIENDVNLRDKGNITGLPEVIEMIPFALTLALCAVSTIMLVRHMNVRIRYTPLA